MPKPRKQRVSLDATPWYLGVSRCASSVFVWHRSGVWQRLGTPVLLAGGVYSGAA
ncbi:hypothetical protein [Oceanobacter antarcticus]|uniref:Transposase of IS4/5 family n=1 Tax=Oceanobacter antarcticus TaxID=3133425 RepID=A0ABW8NKQ5_9GAMM